MCILATIMLNPSFSGIWDNRANKGSGNKNSKMLDFLYLSIQPSGLMDGVGREEEELTTSHPLDSDKHIKAARIKEEIHQSFELIFSFLYYGFCV